MQKANWLVDIWGFQQLQHGRHISAFSHTHMFIQSCHFTKAPIGAGGTDFGRLAAGAFDAKLIQSETVTNDGTATCKHLQIAGRSITLCCLCVCVRVCVDNATFTYSQISVHWWDTKNPFLKTMIWPNGIIISPTFGLPWNKGSHFPSKTLPFGVPRSCFRSNGWPAVVPKVALPVVTTSRQQIDNLPEKPTSRHTLLHIYIYTKKHISESIHTYLHIYICVFIYVYIYIHI